MLRRLSDGLQDLEGRKDGGNGGATKAKGRMGSVWEVVSALASALTDARDQLVTLMHNSTAPRMTGGCSRHTTPARSNSAYPGAGTWIRNVHRGHAHGHVAFGCSSEYRLHPTPVRVRQPRPIFRPRSPKVRATSQESRRRSPNRCKHPLHKMHVSPPRIPSPRPVHLGAGRPRSRPRSKQCSRPSSRCGGSSPRQDRGDGTRRSQGSPASCNRKSPSPDAERCCIGSQYAQLLREEAFQLRERRIAEESTRRGGRRPPRGRC